MSKIDDLVRQYAEKHSGNGPIAKILSSLETIGERKVMPGMSVSLKNLGAITMFIEDVERSKTFYRDVLAMTLVFEDENSAVFDIGNTMINLLKVSEAPKLIAPAKVATQESGSRVQLTIWVEDTNAVCAEMERRGVTLLNGPIDRAWGMRTASVADPDGHIWEFAQNLSESPSA